MKQAVKTYGLSLKNEITVNFVYQILFLCFGFIASKGSVAGEFSPFGTSLVAGVPKKYIAISAIGATIGYIFPIGNLSGFKYIAAVFAAALIRYSISGFSKLYKHAAVSGIISFCAVLFTGIAVIAGNTDLTLKIIAEAFLSSAGAYFINLATKIKPYNKSGLLTEELVSVCFVLSIIILGLMPIGINEVSLGRIVAVIFILTAAKMGGSAIGALSGVLFGFVVSIGFSKADVGLFYMAAGGLFAGFFSKFGKMGAVLSFLIVSLVTNVFLSNQINLIVVLIECIIASGVFFLLPTKLALYLSGLFLSKPENQGLKGVKGALVMKLQFASKALNNVSTTVKDVSNELSRINSPNYEDVLKRVEHTACNGCSLNLHCWENNRSETVEAVMGLAKIIRQPNLEVTDALPHNFLGRCLRFSQFKSSVNKHYLEYLNRINAENRVAEIRGVVEDHFNGISNMLYDLSEEFKSSQNIDEKATEDIIAALHNLNIIVNDCSATTDNFGRLSADIRVKLQKDTILNKKDILRRLSIVCNRDFDIPQITKANTEAFISITEKAVYYCEMGVAQFAAEDNAMCGDNLEYFSDGKGRLVMLLSDGMGVGGRAAVDSAMVTGLLSRLVKSGFGYDCALKIVNSSMLFKSTDESLATVDISVVDLFNGTTEFFKAGAAPTIVRRRGRTAKAQSTSLPAGILKDVAFDKAQITLKNEDIILMMSDGVVNDGTDWICEYLTDFDGTAQQLADNIANMARRRRTDNHEDDITVMAAILKKA